MSKDTLDRELAIAGVPASATVLAIPDDGRVIVLKTVKNRPAPKISYKVEKNVLTGHKGGVTLSLASPLKPVNGESQKKERDNHMARNSAKASETLNAAPASEAPANGAEAPASPAPMAATVPAAPVLTPALPEGFEQDDIEDRAAKKLEEYRKAVIQESIFDRFDAYLGRDDASLYGLAALVNDTLAKHGDVGKAACMAPVRDFIKGAKKPSSHAASGEGDDNQERAVELTPEETTALDTRILEHLGKNAKQTVGEIVKAVGYNSPTVQKRLPKLLEANKVTKEGKLRATRYSLSGQAELPATAAPATTPAAS